MSIASAASAQILCKGSNFLGLLKAVNKCAPSAYERMMTTLPREVGESLQYGHIVSVGWYPASWYAELHASVDKVTSGGSSFARLLGHQATTADFTGIHRLIASVLTVETVFGQAHRLMGLYWKGGTIDRLELVPGRTRIRFAGWTGFSRFVWEDIVGSMEAILELCGAKNIRCRAVASLNSTDVAEFELRWT